MNTKIAIGQYYPVESAVHSLDSRVKLVSVLAFIVVLFFISSFWSYFFAAGCLAAFVYVSRVPPRFLLRGLRSVLFLMLFTVVLNVFFTPGKNVLFTFYFITITSDGLILSAKMALRLTLLIIASSLLTLTTSPIQLTDAIEYLLKPLKKIRVPAHEIAMMMTIALRFIPTLIEETDKIMKAQMARGADFDTGGVIKKAKSLIPLLVPLFISAFRRAEELAMAMEARCYRGDINRTKMKQMILTRSDYIASCGMVILLLGMLLINVV